MWRRSDPAEVSIPVPGTMALTIVSTTFYYLFLDLKIRIYPPPLEGCGTAHLPHDVHGRGRGEEEKQASTDVSHGLLGDILHARNMVGEDRLGMMRERE